jgi:hypothetical protein
MRYTVDLAEVGRAIDHVVRAMLTRRGGASRHLDRLADGLPRGVTTGMLPDLAARWRARERRIDVGLAEHADNLRAAGEGYAQAEADAADALQDPR